MGVHGWDALTCLVEGCFLWSHASALLFYCLLLGCHVSLAGVFCPHCYKNFHLYCYNVLLDCDICPWDVCEAGVWSPHCCHCAVVVCVIKLWHKIKFALESWDIWLTLTFAFVGCDIFIAVWWHLHCFGPWHLHRQAVTSALVCGNICSVRLCDAALFCLQCWAVVSAS